MSELRGMMQALDAALQDMVPPDLKAEGWRYQDFDTRFSPEAWGWLKALLGEGNFQIVCGSSGKDKNGEPWIRGQMLISPQGYENLRDKERRDRILARHP